MQHQTACVIDLHSHVLPGMDDGAENIKESVEMLVAARSEGIDVMVCTPHLVFDGTQRRRLAKAMESLETLRSAAETAGIGITLLGGFELMLDESIYTCPRLTRYTIEGTRMLLFEAGSSSSISLLFDASEWLIEKGYTPVLAHPERGRRLFSIFHPERLRELRRLNQKGLLLQLNASSLTGKSGLRLRLNALKIAKGGYDFIVASDAHSMQSRPPLLSPAFHLLERLLGAEKAAAVAARPMDFIQSKAR